MTRSEFTFYYYIMQNDTYNIRIFMEYFGSKIENISDDIMSSKKLINVLDIQTVDAFKIFREVYLDYFKEKIKYTN